MDEIVEVVDENDKVIGKELKSVCKMNDLMVRGSNILVFKDDSYDELLIQKRSMKKVFNPGLLCTAGGHLQPCETYLDGARRELFEEEFNSQKIDGLKFEELFKILVNEKNSHGFITVFRTTYPGPFTPDSNEVEISFFKNINEVMDEIDSGSKEYTPTTVVLLKEYQKRFM